MAPSVCHTCQAPLDPARAPVARIRGAKIVSFCSAACADGVAQTAPAGADDPAPPAPSVASSAPDSPASSGPERVETATDLADRREPDESPASDDGSRDYAASARPRGSRRNKIIAISAAIMMGGMAITIINAVSPSAPSSVRAAQPVPASAPAATVPGSSEAAPLALAEDQSPPGLAQDAPPNADASAEPLTPEALRERAIATLRQFLTSPSDRIQRIAAMALARIRDPAALDQLARLLEAETAELGKVEIAYALARAGNASAQRMLRRRLQHKRRDVRVDAARALASLGDDTGVPVIEGMMSLRTHRIGAAGLLARMKIQRGVKALEKELADETASEENRIRAAVALGSAGHDSVRERLRALLGDGRYHVGAADALATLGDAAALPALERQLQLPSLRVRAALGLRRMDATVDLSPLEAALDHGSDPARVSAAEAILILTGPKQQAELD